LLAETVYAGSAAQQYEHHMAYCPTAIFGGGTWDSAHGSEHPSWYKSSTLHRAWGLLIDAAKSECGAAPLSKALIFDLVDVGREYLSIVPCHAASSALSGAKTSAAVVAANSSMAEFMSDLDRLLGASDGFLLGQWVDDARKLATTAGASGHSADFLEWNARSQVTSWIPSERCDGNATALNVLYDYGNKMWSGLVKGYYDRRYQIYAQSKRCTIEPGVAGCDGFTFKGQLMKLACEFQHETNSSELSATAVGDAVAISEELFKKYAPSQ
jgi:alpha-N-acetylglucosaminidase